MRTLGLDHMVLTVMDVDMSCEFYQRVPGMERVTFGDGRIALHFGQQKNNLHLAGKEFQPHATSPTSGSADICLRVDLSPSEIEANLQAHKIQIVEGPVTRTGATGTLSSVYIRDPDSNLIELGYLTD